MFVRPSIAVLFATLLIHAPACKTPAPAPVSPRTTTGQDSAELIQVTGPKPRARVQSPLQLTGQARGYWFFEANLPVKLLDGNGRVIGESYVTASKEWMTTEFVPFTGTLTFEAPTTATGTVVFQKANASDLPQHDDALHVPVRFSP